MPQYSRQICVIVDAYSTGKKLAPTLYGPGYPCIHIRSSSNLPEPVEPKNFNQLLTFDGDFEVILNELRKFDVKFVMAGSESGIELTDRLNAILGLPGNKPELSRSRRDKFLMTEGVSQAGLKTVEHFKSTDVGNIVDWAQRLNQWPVVLKPLASQSGDHVFFCHTEQEVQTAFEKITSSTDLFGDVNLEVLVQSLNRGEEYIVNTVSCLGTHFLVEVWLIKRHKDSTVYDSATLLPLDSPEVQSLFDYTTKVLDTVGIQNGPGTTELKYTPAGGPVLIETTSRPMAGAPLSLSYEMYRYNQVTLSLEAALNPENFAVSMQRLYGERERWNRMGRFCYAMAVILISDVDGVLQKDLDLTPIPRLSTFHAYDIQPVCGARLTRTVNSLTSPGEIYLLGDSADALKRDYDTIRRLEAEGLYRNAIRSFSLAELVTSLSGTVASPRADSAPGGTSPASTSLSH